MIVVHKYALPFHRVGAGVRFDIELPRGARFLCCAVQHDEPVTWWEVDPAEPMTDRSFVLYHTGQQFASWLRRTYLGMLMSNDGGTWIGHLYEINAPTGVFRSELNRGPY
jgi:hypothetical protein